jgi:Protein of unknown function with PCYCGC motif
MEADDNPLSADSASANRPAREPLAPHIVHLTVQRVIRFHAMAANIRRGLASHKRGARKMARNFLVALLILFFVVQGSARAQQSSDHSEQGSASAKKSAVPPYHASPPSETLPDTIDPKQFGDAVTQNIYALAAQVKEVLYQEPCYCGCDKDAGHKSLLDCYVDRHSTFCDVCKKEAVYTYVHAKKGETAEQIRKEIIEGKWKDVDLTKYEKPLDSK